MTAQEQDSLLIQVKERTPVGEARYKPVPQLQGLRLPHVGGPIIDATLVGPVRGDRTERLRQEHAAARDRRCARAAARERDDTGPNRRAHQDGGDALPLHSSLLECLRTLDCPLRGSELRTRLALLRLDAARMLLAMVMLSAGERLKAALACALWRNEPARLLVLDQPTNHLDRPCPCCSCRATPAMCSTGRRRGRC